MTSDIRQAIIDAIDSRRLNAGELLDALSETYPREQVRKAITDMILSDTLRWRPDFTLERVRANNA